MEMWCAARHCAFESHPLRHAGAKETLLQLFYYFLGLRRKGGFVLDLYFFLADSAVLRYDKRKATNEREGAVSRKLRCT